jgi:hypothetical protein
VAQRVELTVAPRSDLEYDALAKPVEDEMEGGSVEFEMHSMDESSPECICHSAPR